MGRRQSRLHEFPKAPLPSGHEFPGGDRRKLTSRNFGNLLLPDAMVITPVDQVLVCINFQRLLSNRSVLKSCCLTCVGCTTRLCMLLAISGDVFENSDYDRGRAKING
jgi:hypothetical protein